MCQTASVAPRLREALDIVSAPPTPAKFFHSGGESNTYGSLWSLKWRAGSGEQRGFWPAPVIAFRRAPFGELFQRDSSIRRWCPGLEKQTLLLTLDDHFLHFREAFESFGISQAKGQIERRFVTLRG